MRSTFGEVATICANTGQGAGTYGIVREAEGPTGKVAVKIILKKNVKGNEQMVIDELALLKQLDHPHIVRFVDWFESRVSREQNSGSREVLSNRVL